MYIPVMFGNAYSSLRLGLYKIQIQNQTDRITYTAPNGQRKKSPDLSAMAADTGLYYYYVIAVKDSINDCTELNQQVITLIQELTYPISCYTTTITLDGSPLPNVDYGSTYQTDDGDILILKGETGTGGGQLSTTKCMFPSTIESWQEDAETITTGSICVTFTNDKSDYTNNPTTLSVTEGSIVNYYNEDTSSNINEYNKFDGVNLNNNNISLEAWIQNIGNSSFEFRLDGSYIDNCDAEYVNISTYSPGDNTLATRGVYKSGSVTNVTDSATQSSFPYPGNWHHHIVSYNSSSNEIYYYQDGSLIGSASTSFTNQMNNPYWYLDGNMKTGEFRIYPFELNASQSLYNYNQTKTRYGS